LKLFNGQNAREKRFSIRITQRIYVLRRDRPPY